MATAVEVGSPLGDRGERTRPGQHTAHRQAQDHRQPVPHAPPVPGISHPGQHRQQPPPIRSVFRQISDVADSWVNGEDGKAGMVPRDVIRLGW